MQVSPLGGKKNLCGTRCGGHVEGLNHWVLTALLGEATDCSCVNTLQFCCVNLIQDALFGGAVTHMLRNRSCEKASIVTSPVLNATHVERLAFREHVQNFQEML